MNVQAIKTHHINHGESLSAIIDHYLPEVPNQAIIAITSKMISILEGCIIPKGTISKEALIQQEADWLLKSDTNPYGLYLTIKNGVLIPSAGIDESNVDNAYVCHPYDVQKTAGWIWQYLKTKHNVQLGVIIADSHTTIMRRGVTGIALGWCGLQPLYSYVGKPDLYHQPLKVTQINMVDALAVTAMFVMGEGDECTPMAIIQNAPRVTFIDDPVYENNVSIPLSEDLYAPLLQSAVWIKGDKI
jgi:dihydrofolate synthase / folylpolyglutamate synthase